MRYSQRIRQYTLPACCMLCLSALLLSGCDLLLTAVYGPFFENTGTYTTVMPQNDDPTDVYYPIPDDLGGSDDTFPVALLLQGGRVDKSYYSGFARKVAQYGFIVVVPNHEFAFSVPGFETTGLFAEQSQLYDALEFMGAENQRPDFPLAGHVDTSTLVMLGHSYGAACTIGAIQNDCEYPFCPEGEEYVRPTQLKAAAFCGINTKPRGNPYDDTIRETHNMGMPMAFVNGSLDGNATYDITKTSYELIEDPPKMLVFINGANHYAMCDSNNPPGPGPDNNVPVLDQEVSIETAARWCAMFLRAYALDDHNAYRYINQTGRNIDPNVEVISDPE